MGPARRKSLYGIPQFAGTGNENRKFPIEKFLKSVLLVEVLTLSSDQVKSQAAQEAVKFIEQDSKASNWIFAFIHDDLIELIRAKETAKEIWVILANVGIC